MYSGTVRRVSLQDRKLVTVSIKMEYIDSKNDMYKECFYGGKLKEYIRWLNAEKKPLHDVLCFRKEINGITVDIALQWCVDVHSETMLGYANSFRTINGGTHIDGVKASIPRTLNSLAKKLKVGKGKDITLSWEHVREGLTCIVSVTVPNPEFEGKTQMRLGNQYVKEIVDLSVQENLTEYFELHPDVLDSVISKSFNAYKTALAVKRARELFRSENVSPVCTIPEKLTSSSSGKPETFIGGGDTSGGPPKHSTERRLERKRKRTHERPRSGEAVYTGPGEPLENTSDSSFEKKSKKPKYCVPSSHPYFSTCQTADFLNPSDLKDAKNKTPKDVTHGLNKTRAAIPIGPRFQAEIPVWIAPTKKGKFYGSPGDSQTLRWLGIGVWPTYSLKKKVHYKKVGEGRSNSCSCASPWSTNCIKQHTKEARELLEKEIGKAFYTWKFDKMGEVVSNSWTAKEEQRFDALVKKNPLSNSEGFWELALKSFPRKSKKDLLSYYHNVFLNNLMRKVACSYDDPINSDDDHDDGFLAG